MRRGACGRFSVGGDTVVDREEAGHAKGRGDRSTAAPRGMPSQAAWESTAEVMVRLDEILRDPGFLDRVRTRYIGRAECEPDRCRAYVRVPDLRIGPDSPLLTFIEDAHRALAPFAALATRFYHCLPPGQLSRRLRRGGRGRPESIRARTAGLRACSTSSAARGSSRSGSDRSRAPPRCA